MICPKCNKKQLYEKTRDGIIICYHCEHVMPKADKKPESTNILMSNNGHSKPRTRE